MSSSELDAPLVTVVVTTYDRPELCKRAVESVHQQEYEPLEVIVVEDGTETEVEEWVSAEYPATEYVRHEENRGLAAARNTGLERATGDYMAYLDDDDIWKPTRISTQVDALSALSPKDRENVGVVYCGVERRKPDGEILSTGSPGNDGDLASSIRENGASTLPSTFLFDRDALEDVGGFDESLPSSIDHDIWMALADGGYRALAVDEPLVVTYLSNRGSMVTNTKPRIAGVEQFLEKWEPLFTEWFGPQGAEQYRQQYFARVIASLAAKNLVGGSLKEAWTAVKAIFTYSDQYRYNIVALVQTAIVTAVVTFCSPRVVDRLSDLKNAVW